jgi:hypothetical protein
MQPIFFQVPADSAAGCHQFFEFGFLGRERLLHVSEMLFEQQLLVLQLIHNPVDISFTYFYQSCHDSHSELLLSQIIDHQQSWGYEDGP